MNITTKIVIGGVAVIPAIYIFGLGIGAAVWIVEEDLKVRKAEKAKTSPGPKPEKIKTPWTRKKVHNQFKDIIDQY